MNKTRVYIYCINKVHYGQLNESPEEIWPYTIVASYVNLRDSPCLIPTLVLYNG